MHLEQVEKQTGKPPQGLIGPDLPYQLEHVWHWFLDLHASRSNTGFGEAPITYTDLDAWQRVTHMPLRAFEAHLIRRLDRVYLKLAAERAAKKGGSNG